MNSPINPNTMSAKTKECPVCLDKYTEFVRKPVVCAYCDYSVCNVCTKRYLTEGILDAHCMSCRRAWNDEFLDLNFTKAFRTGPYKKHREDVLLDREVGLLPTRQPRVEAVHKLREAEADMKKITDELLEWEKQRSKITAKTHGLSARIHRYTAESKGAAPPAWTMTDGERASPEKERAKFIMKCPAEDCRGFLSSAYKCGTCQMWACSDCLVVKGKEKDAEHTCDPGVKESVQLIVKESRPCPKCGERISKIDGCDQMFCVECHTAFSWNTGHIVTGVIHNPHYYEFLRKQGNGVAPRNAGDVPCGGVPYYHHLQRALTRITLENQRTVMAIHRVTQEIQDYRLGQYQGHFNVNDNGDLGVQYLMKEIDRDAMKQELAKREFKRNKHLAIRAVLEMFVTTSTMMLNTIMNNAPTSDADFQATLVEYTNLRLYVNESLLNVSRMKTCSVPLLGDTWEWKPFNKAPPKVRAPKEKKGKDDESIIEISDDEEMTEEQAAKQKGDADAAKQKAEEIKKKRLEALKKAREAAKAKRDAAAAQTTPNA